MKALSILLIILALLASAGWIMDLVVGGVRPAMLVSAAIVAVLWAGAVWTTRKHKERARGRAITPD